MFLLFSSSVFPLCNDFCPSAYYEWRGFWSLWFGGFAVTICNTGLSRALHKAEPSNKELNSHEKYPWWIMTLDYSIKNCRFIVAVAAYAPAMFIVVALSGFGVILPY
ncbi:hypothetical protein ACFQY8_05815 [Alloscardovia venturai]|uniref:Uncharacterized protein n=1 Tax=Alloscardovia venturai TaxID=1769421 RepID=A0ABW2Y686_9BIFI